MRAKKTSGAAMSAARPKPLILASHDGSGPLQQPAVEVLPDPF